MIRGKILRSAARIVLGALVAAYAMLSLHVNARQAAAHEPAIEAAADDHCNPKGADAAVLLCKHHCQSEIQTLDHPHAGLPAIADAPVLMITLLDAADLDRAPRGAAARPELRHHGGAPPPYASTARLRI